MRTKYFLADGIAARMALIVRTQRPSIEWNESRKKFRIRYFFLLIFLFLFFREIDTECDNTNFAI